MNGYVVIIVLITAFLITGTMDYNDAVEKESRKGNVVTSDNFTDFKPKGIFNEW